MAVVSVGSRLVLGGAVWGGLTGIAVGAVLGIVSGWFANDLSWGLDGALLGVAVLAPSGALYGLLLCRGDPAPEYPVPPAPLPSSGRRPGRRADRPPPLRGPLT